MVEYPELVWKLMQVMRPMMEHASEASVVADVIYQAATDGTNQLRYTAGDDAKQIMENSNKFNDAEFAGGIKSQFGS